MWRLWWFLAGIVTGAAVATGVVALWPDKPEPTPTVIVTPVGMCPSDDSCDIDYEHGHVTVTRITP